MYKETDFDVTSTVKNTDSRRSIEHLPAQRLVYSSFDVDSLNELRRWLAAEPDYREGVMGARHLDQLSQESHATYRSIVSMLEWGTDEETRSHLDPKPPRWLPDHPISAHMAVSRMIKHYLNFRDDTFQRFYESGITTQSTDIYTVTAKDMELARPAAIGTLRLRNDPYISLQESDACIETLIVNPHMRGRKVGSQMVGRMVEEAFDMGKDRVYTWIMAPTSGDIMWQKQWSLFLRRGFKLAEDPEDREVSLSAHWFEHCKKQGIDVDRYHDSLLLKTSRDTYIQPNVEWWGNVLK